MVYQRGEIVAGSMLYVGNRRRLVSGWSAHGRWLLRVRENRSVLEKEQCGQKWFGRCWCWVVRGTQSPGHRFSAECALTLSLQCVLTNKTDWEHFPCLCNCTHSYMIEFPRGLRFAGCRSLNVFTMHLRDSTHVGTVSYSQVSRIHFCLFIFLPKGLINKLRIRSPWMVDEG